MSSLDVEALLDETAKASTEHKSTANEGSHTRDRDSEGRRDSRERDSRRGRDGSRGHDRDDRRRPRSPDVGTPKSDGSGRGRGRGGRRSRSRGDRDDDRYSRRYRDGDHYRSGRRSRSRSPHRYRPNDGRDRRDRRDRDGYDRARARADDRRGESRKASPSNNEEERDRRTVFVQQLAARLRTRELKEFFEKVGPVNEAQIVKDRVSGRSKGVGYVEFKEEDSVQGALQLTGQKLLGIPVIVQVTEAEKNRQAKTSNSSGNPNSVPFHRLYVGNIHFNVTEEDLQSVFASFGELEFVQLQKDENGRSRGYGFVQFSDANQAREALDKLNGFDLAGRPIRVGLGNDKFTPESTANLLRNFQGQNGQFQGSAFSGAGGRGNSSSTFDKAGGRDNEKSAGGASALDDTDVAGVNFSNYSRDDLMRKLARTDEPSNSTSNDRQMAKPKPEAKPLPVSVNTASRCVKLYNMFDPDEEEGDGWVKELEDEVRAEAEDKYGHVVHIAADATTKGEMFLKFDKVQGGENAIKGLNGRFFGGRMIRAESVVDVVYSSMFSRARAF